jgi:2-phosphosulfolactate phosphatase
LEVKILHLIDGAKNAAGLTVVIDVFRAFSVACYVANNGASKIIPVGDIEIAYRLKTDNPDYVLIGERKGKIQPGFDFGNSPTHVETTDFTGKTVVQTTSAGTQGIVNASNADEIITGSLINAKAVAAYIQNRNPKIVSLVCMGKEALRRADEDTFCAEYIKSLLEGTPYTIDNAVESLKHGSGKRFFDLSNADWCPERDFYLCTDINRFDFVLKAKKNEDGLYYLTKELIHR